MTDVRPIVPRRGIAAEVADEIRATILARRLSAGDHLGTEASVAAAFGVSRPTLREALSGLEALGMIVKRRGVQGGITVTAPEPDRFVQSIATQSVLMDLSADELLDTQLAVEAATARLAAQRVVPADMTRLRRIHGRTRRAVGRTREFAAAGMEFHLAVADLAASTLLKAMMDTIRTIRIEGSEERVRSLDGPTLDQRHQSIIDGHESILVALADADPDQAMLAMSRHLEAHRAEPEPGR